MKILKHIIFSDFISNCSITAFITYVYWFLYKSTQSQSLVSLVGFFPMLATLGSILGGYMVDRYSKIKLLRHITLSRIIIFLLSLILSFFIKNTLIIIVLVILNSILNVVYVPLTESIAPTFVHNNRELVTANSFISLASQLSSIVSSGLSLIMVIVRKPRWAMFYMLISLFFSFIILINLHADKAPKIDKHDYYSIKSILNRIKSGIVIIMHNKLISYMILIAIISNFCFWTI